MKRLVWQFFTGYQPREAGLRLSGFGVRLRCDLGFMAALWPRPLRCLCGEFSEHRVDDADVWRRSGE